MAMDDVAVSFDVMNFPTRLFVFRSRASRVLRKCSLRPSKIGDAHRRQLHAVQLFRRKRDRDANDATEDAVFP